MPKVSVVIPAYNCGEFISAAIESALNQTYRDYEIIVVNDGSTDHTGEILKGYNGKIRLFSQENAGPSRARNLAISKAQGEYIAFLDADDIWLPQKLEKQVNILDSHPLVGLVCSNAYITKDKISTKKKFFCHNQPKGRVLKYLFINNFIITSTVITRLDCFRKLGLFNLALPPAADYDMWLRISEFFDVEYINIPLVRHRELGGISRDRVKSFLNQLVILNKVLKRHPELRKTLGKKVDYRFAETHYGLGRAYFFQSKPVPSREEFVKSIKLFPFFGKSYIFYLVTFFNVALIKKLIWLKDGLKEQLL